MYESNLAKRLLKSVIQNLRQPHPGTLKLNAYDL